MYDTKKATLEYAKLLMKHFNIAMIDYWDERDSQLYYEVTQQIQEKEAEMKANGMEIPFKDGYVDDIMNYIKKAEHDEGSNLTD